MTTASEIALLGKQIGREHSRALLSYVEEKGFIDLRPSFFEILLIVAESDGVAIKAIGQRLGLKKQTMTTHINELVTRGYITKTRGPQDKREQIIRFTAMGESFKHYLLDGFRSIGQQLESEMGEYELERLKNMLEIYKQKIFSFSSRTSDQ